MHVMSLTSQAHGHFPTCDFLTSCVWLMSCVYAYVSWLELNHYNPCKIYAHV